MGRTDLVQLKVEQTKSAHEWGNIRFGFVLEDPVVEQVNAIPEMAVTAINNTKASIQYWLTEVFRSRQENSLPGERAEACLSQIRANRRENFVAFGRTGSLGTCQKEHLR